MMAKVYSPGAMTAALGFLSKRPYSAAEMRGRLEKKGFAHEDISGALERLIELGYLNDADFAERAAASWSGRGWGPLKIAAALRAKGVGEETVKKAVEPLTKEAELKTAEKALSGWLRKNGLKPPLEEKDHARACRFLASRGFSIGAALKATGPVKRQ